MAITKTTKTTKEELLKENLDLLFAISDRVRSKNGTRIFTALQSFIQKRPLNAVRYGSQSPFKAGPEDEVQLRPPRKEVEVSLEFLLKENETLREIIEREAHETIPTNWQEALWPAARALLSQENHATQT